MEDIAQKVFAKSGRADTFLNMLRELWVEVNVLRRAAVFVRQSFRDMISLAQLADPKDERSKIARSLIPIDIMQAKSLRSNSSQRLQNIEDCFMLYIEREAFREQGILNEVEAIDSMITRGLLSRDKVDRFWVAIQELLCERVCRHALLDSKRSP